ncbi:hypothetical protein ILYODFUR_037908 [Ilyodon furcidens]|uniref:Uncharacterized protein n=1 Tax=Ilyodon furcidens TaxID=33524 RepID=A0ABV0T3Y2_9TELE
MQHSLEKNIRSAMVRVKRVNCQAEEKRNACQDDEQATASSISSTSSSEIPIGIPVITYSTDDEDQTSATTAETQTSGQQRGMSVLCETPVTVYQHSSRELDALKKSTYYFCKDPHWTLCRKNGLWNHMA